jgi:hypothetical protein
MRSRNSWTVVIASAIFLSGIGFAGCKEESQTQPTLTPMALHDDSPHNMKRVKCRKDTDRKDVDIEVKSNAQVLKDIEDRAVFACKGEKVYWHTKEPDITFEVDFPDKAKAQILFHSQLTNFKSHAVDPSTHSGDRQVTSIEELESTEFYSHKYSVVVRKGTTVIAHIDPHVIPMGK